MKQILWALSLALILMPAASNAEIYKWKDKNGVVRYSDIPPPSNIPYESMGKKANKSPTPAEAPAAPAGADATAPVPDPQQRTPEAAVAPDADKQRQEEEAAKQKAAAAETEQKQKQEQCSNAKARLNSFQQGGRIYRTNENGEREYLEEADIVKGLEEAQIEVDKYCQ